MPGITSLGLRYPLQGETVDSASWQNLANDVDALMTTMKTARDTSLRPPTASIGHTGGGPAVVTATGVDAVMLFDVENWDTANLANLGVNNDRLTLSTGLWFARATAGSVSGYATIAFARTGLITGATLWAHMEMSATAVSSAGPITASGLVLVTVAGTALQQRVRWNGTGGPATWGTAALQVYKVRELADL